MKFKPLTIFLTTKELAMNKLVMLLYLFLIPLKSYAYIGPGMGGGVIAAIIGFFAAILLGLWGILYYPIKRALKKRKDKKISPTNSNDQS
jgi:hypothetical protein